jgi:hypothetical protein
VKTLDWIPVALIAGVVAFVGIQVASAPASPIPPAPAADTVPAAPALVAGPAVRAQAAPALAASAPVAAGLTTTRDTRASAPAPVRDLDDIARRIALGRKGTYVDAVLEQQNNTIYRWPERIVEPLRIWVAPTTDIRDWRPEYAQAARDAFSEWSDVGIPVQFLFVRDSVNADVLVTWTDRFDEGKTIGRTLRKADRHSWLFHAGIVIALHTVEGETLDPAIVRATARHEVGHLLGLPHSPSAEDVMYPTVTAPDLSPADRATIRLIYTLPPGVAR